MSGYNVAAINGMYPMYNSYMNQSALSNMYDMDMGMYGSIFNGGMMPFMPAFGGGMNYDYYFNNMKNYLNFTSDYNLQMVENQRRNDLRINATDEGIRNAAAVLREKIAADEQEQILGAYKSFVEAVAAKYPGESAQNIINRAKNTYSTLYNTSITDDIRSKGSNSFKQGLFQTLTFGLANNTTAEENISAISGQPVARSEQISKFLGRSSGGFIVGTGAVLGLSQIKALKHLKGKWAVLGGLAGAVISGITALCGVGTRSEKV